MQEHKDNRAAEADDAASGKQSAASVRLATDALGAIAGMVGCADPFNPEPRDVYLRVRRLVNEHERMRVRLVRILEEADEANAVLRDVDAGGDHP